MKSLSIVLAAALVAGSCTMAVAQGAGGADSAQQGTMKDPDKNPTGPGANPAAGNTAGGSMSGGQVTGGTMAPGSMRTAPASNTRSDDPARPPAARDATGASTGSGGSK